MTNTATSSDDREAFTALLAAWAEAIVWDQDGWRCVLTQLTPISATEA